MNRNEFISMLGLGAVASVIPVSDKEGKDEVIEASNGKDYETLYKAFQDREPVKIGGIDFIMTEINVEGSRHGRTTMSLSLQSTGDINS